MFQTNQPDISVIFPLLLVYSLLTTNNHYILTIYPTSLQYLSHLGYILTTVNHHHGKSLERLAEFLEGPTFVGGFPGDMPRPRRLNCSVGVDPGWLLESPDSWGKFIYKLF